jgi:hypothetical protein
MRDTLAVERYPIAPADVSVRRIAGRLKVQVSVPAVVPERAREIVAVRIVGRLRAFDPHAAGIDIGVTTTASPPATVRAGPGTG